MMIRGLVVHFELNKVSTKEVDAKRTTAKESKKPIFSAIAG